MHTPKVSGKILLLICLSGFAVFSKGLFYPFVFDDYRHLVENPAYHPPSWTALLSFWKGFYFEMYLPMVYSVWFALVKLSDWVAGAMGKPPELLPVVFHSANLGVHLANGWLVFLLLGELSLPVAAASLGALFFVLHPLQVEAVVWISGMKDLLSAFFGLLALREGLRFFRKPNWISYLATTVLLGLAILAKPSSVILPLVLGLAWFAFRSHRDYRELWYFIPWGIISAIATLVTQNSQPVLDPATRIDFIPSFPQRLLIATDAMAFYLKHLIWPTGLSLVYDHSPYSVIAAGGPQVWFSGLTVALAISSLAMISYSAANRRVVWFGFGWFCLGLLPTLGFVPFIFQNISTVADRYAYFSLVGFSIVMAWGMSARPKLILAPAWVSMVLCAGLSWAQVSVWRDPMTLYRYALQCSPNHWFAHQLVGMQLQADGYNQEAILHFEKTVALRPDRYQSRFLLANALNLEGRKSEAIRYKRQGAEAFAEVLREDARAWMAKGEGEKSLHYLELAFSYYPRSAAIQSDWGEVLLQLGRVREARAHFLSAIALNPDLFAAAQRLEMLNRYPNR